MASIDLNEIHSLSEFQRNAKQHIARMKKNRRPIVLTVNGKAEMVGMDVTSYQKMVDELERANAIAGIRLGLESMERGEGIPAKDVLEDLRKEFKLPKKQAR